VPARRILIDGVMRIDPRHTRAWRRLRDQVVAEEPTCRLRFPTICTTASTTADHIKPVSSHPELALERTNLRGACAPCNDARRNLPDTALRLGTGPSEALTIFRP
jgi:5-methylcytosine-specific restriction endonuclease McrA